jgi:hypothetical protein
MPARHEVFDEPLRAAAFASTFPDARAVFRIAIIFSRMP